MTREQFVGNQGVTERWGTSVEAVELDGEYPDTELVVVCRIDGRAAEARYHLWDDGFAVGNGDRTTPDDVAFLVGLDVDTPGEPMGVPRLVDDGWKPPDPAGAVRALERYRAARSRRADE